MTASTFRGTAGCNETTAGILHPDEEALQVQCNDCRITEMSVMGTESCFTTYCIHLESHCRHCMGTASTFRDMAGGSSTTAATLHPAEEALEAHCNH